MNPTDVSLFRELVIKLVLSTDLGKHFNLLKEANEVLVAGKAQLNYAERYEHRHLALQMLIKVSDVGHVIKALPITISWTLKVNAEFFKQGDLGICLI